tara:strand:+ start:1408 stop:3726 length:2319 start_codon:yes stop_codon:yes gene_type:complete
MTQLKSFQVESKLNELIISYHDTPELLFQIPITNGKNGAMPSIDYLQKTVRATRSQLHKHAKLIEAIRLLMIEHDVILVGEAASVLEARREMRNWWKSLSLEEKTNLKTFGNSIQFKSYLSKYRVGKQYKLLSNLAREYNQELLELGVLDKNYVPVKERTSQQNNSRRKIAKEKREDWKYLESLPLDTVDDLITAAEYSGVYGQVKQLFSSMLSVSKSASNTSNYKIAHKHFVDYLTQSSVSPDTPLSEILEEFILSRFRRDYILPLIDGRKMAPHSANTLMSCMRKTLKRATKIKGLGFTSFYDIEGFDASRVTNMYKPYSLKEREQINGAIASDIVNTKKLMEPYIKKGIGSYPLMSDYKTSPNEGTLDNARYLFENYLDCKPVFYEDPRSVYGEAFLRIVHSNQVGLHKLYKSWGIIPIVDRALIAPFILRLAQITGMNSDSICALELDDFVSEHHITKKPCLTYWKERSGGEKAYHLDIFNAELQWLTLSQADSVRDVFDTVKKLTENIRKEAPTSISKRLFLMKSSGTTAFGKVMAVDSLVTYFDTYASKHDLKSDNGEPLQLNVARFRPTFVSELVDKDVSIREIQLMLGHKNLSTTMNYLDRLDFSRIARDKIKTALSKIQLAAIETKPKKKVTRTHLKNENNIIFTTPLGGCANVFEPPEFIKSSSSYTKGQACSQYNKCLSCENVMLTVTHIPELFAMRRDYLLLAQNSKIIQTPYGIVLKENLSLLDDILTPSEDGFSKEELALGEQRSLFVETNIIDSVGA